MWRVLCLCSRGAPDLALDSCSRHWWGGVLHTMSHGIRERKTYFSGEGEWLPVLRWKVNFFRIFLERIFWRETQNSPEAWIELLLIMLSSLKPLHVDWWHCGHRGSSRGQIVWPCLELSAGLGQIPEDWERNTQTTYLCFRPSSLNNVGFNQILKTEQQGSELDIVPSIRTQSPAALNIC